MTTLKKKEPRQLHMRSANDSIVATEELQILHSDSIIVAIKEREKKTPQSQHSLSSTSSQSMQTQETNQAFQLNTIPHNVLAVLDALAGLGKVMQSKKQSETLTDFNLTTKKPKQLSTKNNQNK